VHPFHSCHRIMIATPDGDRSIRIAFDRQFNRHEGRGPVMLRPVKLYSARDPRTGETNESGLNHVLTVEEVISTEPVKTDMDTAADLRHNHQPYKFILDVSCLPRVSLRLRVDPVDNRKRIHSSAASLINAFLQEHWIRVRRSGHVRAHHDRFFPSFHGTCLSGGGRRQLQHWKLYPYGSAASVDLRSFWLCHIRSPRLCRLCQAVVDLKLK
jgi:hypothetical protein